MILIEKHKGVNVLRDDILNGGTKSILMPHIIGDDEEYVYASAVYGGFQIALAMYCKSVNKKATIFCAKRGEMHPNTKKCLEYGANVIEVPFGYMSVLEKHSKDYCKLNNAKKLVFGANTMENKMLIGRRMQDVINELGKEPDEIWCAIGSGTLVESILLATQSAKVYGVQVGSEYKGSHERLSVLKYPKSFDKSSKFNAGFPSMPNYDLKAFEYCVKYKKGKDVLFWNVL